MFALMGNKLPDLRQIPMYPQRKSIPPSLREREICMHPMIGDKKSSWGQRLNWGIGESISFRSYSSYMSKCIFGARW